MFLYLRLSVSGDLELRCFSRQRAFNLRIGQHVDQRRCCVALFSLQWVGGLELALQLDLGLHGRSALNARQHLVVAICDLQAANLQIVVAAGVFIDAVQVLHHGFWRALPDDLIDLEWQLDLDG